MSTVAISNMSFGYHGHDDVFKDFSLSFSSDWRLGLIGRNGRGKTTLLKILAGELQASGVVGVPPDALYFPFSLSEVGKSAMEAAGELFPQIPPHLLESEAGRIGLDPGALARPLGDLSPGENTKLLLAVLFSRDPGLALLDEPAGGLDEAGRGQVAAYLARKRGFVLVSHDRFILNYACDHILAIGRHGPVLHRGNFDSYWADYQKKSLEEARLADRLSSEIDRLGRAGERAAAWARRTEGSKYGGGPVDRGFIGHKSAKMASKAKNVSKRRAAAHEEKKAMLRTEEISPPMTLAPLACPQKRLLLARDLQLGYTEKPVLSGVNLTLDAGERLAVRGANGSGKSLLLSFLAGVGGRRLGGELAGPRNLIVSHVPQSAPRPEGKIAGLCRNRGLEQSRVKTMLHYLGFGSEDLEADVRDLSQGQWRKLLLSLSLAQSAHLYLWDEPLDYMDVFSRRQIEDMIVSSSPTLVVIEHDQAFVGRVATSFLDLSACS
ncbi:MAG: ATP-binding cassette domain-containing protein [Deltaproteobacteria bacterium]|nr:ATP-binding cassette domain-containing protein [Deltaproteobacteria bacterium]